MIKFGRVGEVVSFPAAQIRVEIVAQFPSDVPLPASFNWKILAEAASLTAHEASTRRATEDAYEWSALGIEIYERLAGERTGESRDRFIYDAMRLRHNLLLYCGPHQGDPFADPLIVESMFLKAVPWSLAQTKAKCLESLEPASDAELTLLKLGQRLRLVQSLVERGVLFNRVELASWLELAQLLPR